MNKLLSKLLNVLGLERSKNKKQPTGVRHIELRHEPRSAAEVFRHPPTFSHPEPGSKLRDVYVSAAENPEGDFILNIRCRMKDKPLMSAQLSRPGREQDRRVLEKRIEATLKKLEIA